MATAAPASTAVTIDVTKDLATLSDLKAFFTGHQAAIFTIGSEFLTYEGQPIQKAVGSNPVSLTIEGDPSWRLPSGIVFSLSADATCTVSVSDTSTKFTVTQSVDSTDTEDVFAGPTAGMVYINIDLDFDIKGNFSGSGSVSGIGIAGKASGSESATLSYCYPVNATLEAVAALKAAFADLVFPLQPDCAVSMPAGSIGKVNFDASLNFELDVTYGFGSYKLSAQDLGLTQESVNVAWTKLTPPSVEIDSGAKASLTYTHSDHFGLIVNKTDESTALLYLVRSASNEAGQSIGVNFGISVKSVSATVDSNKLTNAINGVTGGGSPNLRSDVGSYITDLENSLVSKANNWLSSRKADVGLTVGLSQQCGRTPLFTFKVDLSSVTSADLAKQSWAALVAGNLPHAQQIGGFTLLPGSGISESLKHSSSIQLNFFNFHLAQTHDFFKNSVTTLGPDGSIRFFFDVGEKATFSIDTASEVATIHFAATATETDWKTGNYQNVEVDLYIELSQTNKPTEANKIASAIGSLPANADVQGAQNSMLTFVADNNSKTLSLVTIFKPSAYERISCSPFTTDANGREHPPALPQEQDRSNWDAFQTAVISLMPEKQYFVSPMTYFTWMRFNVKSNDASDAEPDSSHVPDRRNPGDADNGAAALYNPVTFASDWQFRKKFLSVSNGFMNLCDNLSTLAGATAEVNSSESWQSLLRTIEGWIKLNTDVDWAKPALRALLSLCWSAGSHVTTSLQSTKDDSRFTCTLTLT